MFAMLAQPVQACARPDPTTADPNMARPPDIPPGPETAAPRDGAKVWLKPPYLFAGALILGLVLTLTYPIEARSALVGGWADTSGVILMILGIIGVFASITQLRAAGTTIVPGQPTHRVVTGGLYRFSRNPMYVAMTAFYIGVSLTAGSLWALLLLIPVLVIMNIGVIAPEERYLERKFGEEYRAYKRIVRRWL